MIYFPAFTAASVQNITLSVMWRTRYQLELILLCRGYEFKLKLASIIASNIFQITKPNKHNCTFVYNIGFNRRS